MDLELRRKLAELGENYALRAELRPVVVARVRLPALVVPVVIQRKQAIRDYRLYWNSLVEEVRAALLQPVPSLHVFGDFYQ